jgi:hypothetical protein
MANKAYGSKTTLIGGGATALDSIDGAGLVDGDIAFVAVSGILYTYRLNATSGATDDGLNVIAPDANAGDKRWILQLPHKTITPGTTVTASTGSPTYIDFTSIPSWVNRITVMFSGLSTNGTSNLIVRLGDSGGIETTSYISGEGAINTSAQAGGASATDGILLAVPTAAGLIYGHMTITLLDKTTNTWVASGLAIRDDSTDTTIYTAGGKALSATLDRIRITTQNGTDTFDAGTINIFYE